MKTEIKNLRIQIDGLGELTKNLKPNTQYSIDLNKIPKGLNVDDVVESFNRTGFTVDNCIKPLPQSFKEIEKATDSLFLAKAWLGKILGELGETTPYVNDGNRKTIGDIEPTADKAVPNLLENMELFCKKPWSNKSHIEKVDWIREEIKKIIDTTTDFSETYPEIGLEQGFVYKYLCEARFWLGFELERLRNEK